MTRFFWACLVAYTLTVPSFALLSFSGSWRKRDQVAETVEWLRFWPKAQPQESAMGRLWRRVMNGAEAEDLSKASALLDQGARRYLTFETDPGGLNNMRMAFEYFVDVAKKSNRVLVLPPKEGWYLLDWGPLNSKAEKVEDRKWITGDHKDSSYQEFWDVDYLGQSGVPTISAEDFYASQKDRLNIPASSAPLAKLVNSPDKSPWKLWLREHAGATPRGCHSGRVSAMRQDVTHVHFTGADNTRFLDCEPEPSPLVHYSPKIFEVAATPVAKMGPSKFVALHLRRNDFQYTQAPKGDEARQLVDNLAKELRPDESVYVASDEVNQTWWDSVREELNKNNHQLYTLKDFQTPELEARGLNFRHSGPVEMLICAAARRFWGTEFSTFTQGIQEMRGHLTEKKRGLADGFNDGYSGSEEFYDDILSGHKRRHRHIER